MGSSRLSSSRSRCSHGARRASPASRCQMARFNSIRRHTARGVPVLLGRDALEFPQSALPVPPIVQEVTEIDAGLVQVRIQPERAADLAAGADVVAQPMQGVAQRSGRLGVVGAPRRGLGEDVSALRVHGLTVERTPHGEHELDIVIVTHGRDLAEELQCRRPLTEAEQRLTHTDERVFVGGIQHDGPFERFAGPGELLSARDARTRGPTYNSTAFGYSERPSLSISRAPS